MNEGPFRLSSLDHHFADFICRIETAACPGLWPAAALASYSAFRGHVCLELPNLGDIGIIPLNAREPVTVRGSDLSPDALRLCITVGKPGDYTPLVLDDRGRLYLHRLWECEKRVAESILARSSVTLPHSNAKAQELLDRYFPSKNPSADMRRKAAEAAVTRRFAVITGGPGTGKTSTVLRILAILAELAGETPPAVLLAAPTGKAAMRLESSIRRSLGELPGSSRLLNRIPLSVSTVHRLLESGPKDTGFRRCRENPLNCGILALDEASMVDLPLMSALMDAMPDDASLILLGDRDQLASVEAGAVLGDICDGLSDSVITLDQSRRFGENSGIGRLARLVNEGNGVDALALFESGGFDDISWRELPAANEFDAFFQAAAWDGYSKFMQSESPHAALESLEYFRILTPHREGRQGVMNLNRLAGGMHRAIAGQGKYRQSRCPVMVTRNSYDIGLFNGDTGALLPDEDGIKAWFTGNSGEPRPLSIQRLPAHETAFAMTVHKSQGSEYDRILLVLPDYDSPLLTRELLYTAITRARKRVEIWGDSEIFKSAVKRRITRNSGLTERLSSA